MIRRIKLLRNIGQFSSVDSGGQIDLNRLVLIFAENGRGKTTLTAIFRSLATGDPVPIIERHRLGAQHPTHVVLDIDGSPSAIFLNGVWDHCLPAMTVFDDRFVDENIHSGLEVTAQNRQNLHGLVLGAQGVTLSKRLQELVSQIEQHNLNLKDKSSAISEAVRQGLSVDDFCALPTFPDVDIVIESTKRTLAAARNQKTVRNTAIFKPLALPSFDIETINQVLGQDLPHLDAASEAKVRNHIAAIGTDGEQWISSGMRRIAAVPDNKTCPFCAQELATSDLLAHYRAYFNESYVGLKRTVALTIDDVRRQHSGDAQAAFERAVRVAVETQQSWSSFCKVPDISIDTEAIGRDWNAAKECVFTTLTSKQSAPLERFELDDEARNAIVSYEQHRNRIADLSDSLIQSNLAITIVKEQADAANLEQIEHNLAQFQASKARHTPEISLLCEKYLEEKEEKVRTEAQRTATRTALNTYQTDIFPSMQNAVNDYLNRFNAEFRLDSVTSTATRGGSACTFNVVINETAVAVHGSNPEQNQPSFRSTLSSGDRNTLALAFFFASLDHDPDLRNKVVVIDDPITSLDDHRAFTTVQKIQHLSERVCQLIILSHDQRFLTQIWSDRNDVAVKISRDVDGSNLCVWDVEEDAITEHDRRDSKLRKYVNNNDGDPAVITTSIRPHLESFLRVAYPQHFPPGTLLGQFLDKCRRMLSQSDEILDETNLQELSELVEYARTHHHDANSTLVTETINDVELKGFIKRTLAFVKL